MTMLFVMFLITLRGISTIGIFHVENYQRDNRISEHDIRWKLLKHDPTQLKASVAYVERMPRIKREAGTIEEISLLPIRHGKYRRRRRCKNRPGCARVTTITRQEFLVQNGSMVKEQMLMPATDDHVPENMSLLLNRLIKGDESGINRTEISEYQSETTFPPDQLYLDVTDRIEVIDDTTGAKYTDEDNTSSEVSIGYFDDKDLLKKDPVQVDAKLKNINITVPLHVNTYDKELISEKNEFDDSSSPAWRELASRDRETIKEINYVNGDQSSPAYLPIDDQATLHESLFSLLTRLFQILRNSSTENSQNLLKELNFIGGTDEDPCQKWLNSKDKLEEAFLGPLVLLPACPCQYPSNIFYDDKIWDVRQEKFFRWRDVSSESQRLDVYKRGASYCVRSLLAQGSGSAAAQHCCYDRRRKLLTRGSGAGTPNFVSPEISVVLHERIDVLPWRLCKGDFSRFNKVRPPNNDNECEVNPPDEEYQRQIDNTKYY